MNEVNKTLYIPLYGKALVSKKGIIIKDEMAQKIGQLRALKCMAKLNLSGWPIIWQCALESSMIL